MTADANEVLRCPLCNLPCRATAVKCDGCGHGLREPVSLDGVRAERAVRRKNIALAIAGIVAMIALNLVVLRHAGRFIFATAPLAWFIANAVRLRALDARLSRL